MSDYVFHFKDKSKLMHKTTTMMTNGQEITDDVRKRIRAALLSGTHVNIGALARANNVPRDFIVRWLDNDPEMKQKYENAVAAVGDNIEQAAIDFCLDESINPIARQKMLEKMLPAFKPERYGENAGINAGVKNQKKIILQLKLPTVKTDDNGVPIAKSKNPLDAEAIECK